MTHRKLLGLIRDATFWRSLVPHLAIEDHSRGARSRTLEARELGCARDQLREEGYFRVAALFDPSQMTAIEKGLTALTEAGWPALFVFLFDDPWRVYAALDQLLGGLLGPGYRPLAACWAWCLPTSGAARGWPPHRDRTTRTVRDVGDPEIITVWVPVTDAASDNGCIYVVPATLDPNYSCDLSRCGVASLQDVRALPAKVGTVLGWNHQLLHWGGRGSARAECPRMSLSAEFQRGDVPLLDLALDEPIPPFYERVAIVGRQVIAYQHMQPPTAKLLDIARQLVLDTRYM
jgi:hypothetical protein